jgi:molybdopterin-containing oxidoreductase family iron-sulfur binding subunit
MEKCNFCVHRLTEAKMEARKLNRDLKDGEVVTACQQTCPTQAISFGNLRDSSSQVAKLSKREDEKNRDRQYEVFPELNFKPAVTYLKKVNHRETEVAHGTSEKGHGQSHG